MRLYRILAAREPSPLEKRKYERLFWALLEMLQPSSPCVGAGHLAAKFSYVVSVGGRLEPCRGAEAGAGRAQRCLAPREVLIHHISAKTALPHQRISRELPVLNHSAIVSGFLEKRAHKKEIKKNKT